MPDDLTCPESDKLAFVDRRDASDSDGDGTSLLLCAAARLAQASRRYGKRSGKIAFRAFSTSAGSTVIARYSDSSMGYGDHLRRMFRKVVWT
jgi:hypothetical protein